MRLSVLGATGSVGRSTLDIVARNPDRFDVVSLVANSDVAGLVELARKVGADCAVLARSDKGAELAEALAGTGIEAAAGDEAVLEAVDRPADMVVAAIVGAAGLRPTLRAMKSSRAVALANKECLVSAGDLFMAEARRSETTVLPVDSEHSAIFQVFEQENADQVEKVILTASGGPFRTVSKAAMAGVTPAQALKHPNWDMGNRITIDSATMMNKGFEVIEAFHLFPLGQDQLEVLVHPQSVVHGLVQYRDGSLLAQLGSPDMRTPIAHCLAWPKRMDVPVERLDLARIGELSFEAPDLDRFRSLALALQAMRRGGGATTILNAADEVAVAAFLDQRIGFMDIPSAVEASLDRLDASHGGRTLEGVEDVLAVDEEARDACREWVASR
ncbi:1-deoxy-D-xylulose-5-phosphate reductoisomerase [Roseibium polysiphoniae]|uniref:1-deoxy-D-xylulose 5-phosphate reductoisomerase n=1 Tax=Roseibium polysiphoniae TaxID=2571221 RepID=A0A944CCH2_9HYPH|nr:1-deoxy-D-xylulose-5-phosphate reductoisomerase [Roseibium polysiphoniae]MBS8259591.1 1-deoxy-D-xylulose-5-phosphate reductoisomerase [Roseibium polysiphoniae]